MATTSDFTPKRRLVSDVTVAINPTVTTTEDHGYEVGQLVRMHVEEQYGMWLDGVETQVLTVPSTTTFTCDLDTSRQAAFSAPSSPSRWTEAHVVPVTGINDNVASI